MVVQCSVVWCSVMERSENWWKCCGCLWWRGGGTLAGAGIGGVLSFGRIDFVGKVWECEKE